MDDEPPASVQFSLRKLLLLAMPLIRVLLLSLVEVLLPVQRLSVEVLLLLQRLRAQLIPPVLRDDRLVVLGARVAELGPERGEAIKSMAASSGSTSGRSQAMREESAEAAESHDVSSHTCAVQPMLKSSTPQIARPIHSCRWKATSVPVAAQATR